MVTDTATDTDMKINSVCTSPALGLMIAFLAAPAAAQQAIPGSSISGNSAASSPSTTPDLGSEESETKTPRAIVVKPRIKFTETWSDNVAIARTLDGKESGFITELAPGVRINAKTARLKAFFDYNLIGQFYTTPSGYSRSQNQLNSFGTLEAVEKWLFLDFSGVIAQQAISAFAPQSGGSANINRNNTEVATYRLSPYIRGQFGSFAEYSLRYNRSTTQASASTVSDIDLSEWNGQIHGSTSFQNLQWAVNATQQSADFSLGRKTDADRLFATGTYAIVPQFSMTLTGGRESNNYASASMESHATYGYGFDWSPTERTKVSALKERRFFGDGHRFNISHRFPLSSIVYSDTRDVAVLPNQFQSAGMGTLYDTIYQLCLLTKVPPDTSPDQADQLANACATDFFRLFPQYSPNDSFLSSRATVQRRQQLALVFQGARNALTVMLNRNENSSILAALSGNDDFSNNNLNSLKQRGVSLNLSHKLSGLSSLNMLVSRQESTGIGISVLNAKTTIYQANLTSALGAKTTGGLTVRHTEFDSSSSPYTENALIGTLSVIF